ncbi:MAG TPA: hypothetical protein VL202_05770 [Pararhizobium sp.]|uniref:hypothetical protein n=1 Tax=Pararhizobium sp. TaxID=1977563 RepID=UPI002CA66D6A|nr:hypothetical protein [Pararhizobium sp.]HTO30668.1 hypothetical protein [Pararhizobium sp.]
MILDKPQEDNSEKTAAFISDMMFPGRSPQKPHPMKAVVHKPAQIISDTVSAPGFSLLPINQDSDVATTTSQ